MEPLHREVHRPSVRLLLSAHAADSRAWLMLHNEETREWRQTWESSGGLRENCLGSGCTVREKEKLKVPGPWIPCGREGSRVSTRKDSFVVGVNGWAPMLMKTGDCIVIAVSTFFSGLFVAN